MPETAKRKTVPWKWTNLQYAWCKHVTETHTRIPHRVDTYHKPPFIHEWWRFKQEVKTKTCITWQDFCALPPILIWDPVIQLDLEYPSCPTCKQVKFYSNDVDQLILCIYIDQIGNE